MTTCVSPTSFLEQMTTGWIFLYLNRALLIFTDRRMLHVPTTTSYHYRDSIAEIRYQGCAAVGVRGHVLTVRYHNGKKDRFLYLPRAQRGKIKKHFKEIKFTNEGAQKGGRDHLCPRCGATLTRGVFQCSGCRLDFKDLATAYRMSILVPGGGYFYTGHWFLGIGDFVVELSLLVLVIQSVASAMAGEQGAGTAAILFGIFLVIEKLITIHHAKRYVSEFIPLDKGIKLRMAEA